MWKDVLSIIAISLGIYSIYNFTFIILRSFINKTKVSKMIYSFKSRRRYYPLFGVLILIINIIGIGRQTHEETIISKYMLSMRINQLYNESGILNKWVMYIFSIFLI